MMMTNCSPLGLNRLKCRFPGFVVPFNRAPTSEGKVNRAALWINMAHVGHDNHMRRDGAAHCTIKPNEFRPSGRDLHRIGERTCRKNPTEFKGDVMTRVKPTLSWFRAQVRCPFNQQGMTSRRTRLYDSRFTFIPNNKQALTSR
jgi:hypothetical protein